MIPMNDEVLVYKDGKLDSWGIAIPSDEAISLKGNLTYFSTLQEMKNAEGELVKVSATLIVLPSADIVNGDLLSFPNGIYPDKKVKVLDVFPITDLSGKLFLKKVVM